MNEPAFIPNITRRKKQMYSLLRSGLAYNEGRMIRHVVLTSSPDSPPLGETLKRIVYDIRRMTPSRLVKLGYIDYQQMGYFYKGKDKDEGLTFEYGGCFTGEGHGVAHLVTVSDYIPVAYLQDVCEKHRGAPNVAIKAVKQGKGKLTAYLLNQYVQGQDAIERIVQSRNFIYPGWRDDQKKIIAAYKEEYGNKAGFRFGIKIWEEHLKGNLAATKQISIDGLDITNCEEHRRIHRKALSGDYQFNIAGRNRGNDFIKNTSSTKGLAIAGVPSRYDKVDALYCRNLPEAMEAEPSFEIYRDEVLLNIRFKAQRSNRRIELALETIQDLYSLYRDEIEIHDGSLKGRFKAFIDSQGHDFTDALHIAYLGGSIELKPARIKEINGEMIELSPAITIYRGHKTVTISVDQARDLIRVEPPCDVLLQADTRHLQQPTATGVCL